MKPDMQRDRAVAMCSIPARHLLTGLITQSDDDGRQDADPRLIRADWYPFDDHVSNEMVLGWLDELERAGLAICYEIDGASYVFLPGFTKNQVINKPKPSKLPSPPDKPQRKAPLRTLTDPVPSEYGSDPKGREWKGREGKGRSGSAREASPVDAAIQVFQDLWPDQKIDPYQLRSILERHVDELDPDQLRVNATTYLGSARCAEQWPRYVEQAHRWAPKNLKAPKRPPSSTPTVYERDVA